MTRKHWINEANRWRDQRKLADVRAGSRTAMFAPVAIGGGVCARLNAPAWMWAIIVLLFLAACCVLTAQLAAWRIAADEERATLRQAAEGGAA